MNAAPGLIGLDDALVVDASLPNARELWERCRDAGRSVCFINTKGTALWAELRETHRHRNLGDNSALISLVPPKLDGVPDWITEIVSRVYPYTLTRVERIVALCEALEYIVQAGIPGDVVECGVWRGGSMMAAALTLLHLGDPRPLWLFDTFEGMPEPEPIDRKVHTGEAASEIMSRMDRKSHIWCACPIDEVVLNMVSTGYPVQKLHFVEGRVEDTLPHPELSEISLLRLDTDWYASTKHELRELYPVLSPGGVLILDDYGHWEGARVAVDEYLQEQSLALLLGRVDYSCRMAVKGSEVALAASVIHG